MGRRKQIRIQIEREILSDIQYTSMEGGGGRWLMYRERWWVKGKGKQGLPGNREVG